MIHRSNGRRAAAATLLVAGLLAVGGCGEHAPPTSTGGDSRAGLSVYKFEGCARCHAIAAVSVGVTGPRLDGEGARRSATWLRAMLPGHLKGTGSAPLATRDLRDLVAYLDGLPAP